MPPAWSAQLITLVKNTGVCSIWTESVFPIGYECDIDTGDAAPVPCGNIRYGVREAEIMRKHITAIVDMGHIYEIERSQFLSEATLAPKPHQKGVHDNCNFKCRFVRSTSGSTGLRACGRSQGHAATMQACMSLETGGLTASLTVPWVTAGLHMNYKLGPRWDDVITWFDFKSETSFGFLSPNYTGQCT